MIAHTAAQKIKPKPNTQPDDHVQSVIVSGMRTEAAGYGSHGNLSAFGLRFSRWAELNSFASSVM